MPNGPQYGSVDTGYAGTWVDEVLQAIGAPTTDSNRAALRAWAASEGTAASNNPLAFSGQYPGATTCLAQCGSSSPVFAYSSPQQGATNTAQFLLSNNYSGVVNAFRSDAGLGAIYGAINASGWCKGCQGGQYPVALSKAAGISGGQAYSAQGAPAGVSLPVVGQIISPAEVDKFKGWFLMISGAAIAVVGLAVVLGSLGLESKAGQLATTVPGVKAAKAASGRRAAAATETRRHEQRVQLVQEKGSQSRASARLTPRSEGGARPATAEHRRQSRARMARARADLSPEERRQVDSF